MSETRGAEAPTRWGAIAERVRMYGHGDRIVGVDIARGLAVLGMFGAHIGVIQAFDWARAATWTGVVSGRSSILFAVLAGVSIAILSGRTRPYVGEERSRARARIAVRATIVLLIGAMLEALDTNVAVILMYYAVYFLLALPFLSWRPAALFSLAAVVAIAMPFALYAIAEWDRSPTPHLLVQLLATGNYPALLWIAFVLVGMGIGRLALGARRVKLWLLAAGVALAGAGYGLGEAADRSVDARGLLAAIATTEPHSGSPFEVVGSTGFALAVLGLCLLAPAWLRWVLFPLAAVGSMALSTYTIQILAIAALEVPVPGETDNSAWAWFAVVALGLSSLWFVLIGRGPLERALTALSRWVAGSESTRPRANTLGNEN
jgi:uncharacterized protein